MKTIWLPLVMVMPLQLLHAQEVQHAPTMEQCRADQKLWFSKLESDAINSVSYRELNGWQSETNKCAIVDPTYDRLYIHTTTETLYITQCWTGL